MFHLMRQFLLFSTQFGVCWIQTVAIILLSTYLSTAIHSVVLCKKYGGILKLLYFSFLTGEGLDNFWKVLVDGRNCSMPITKERFDIARWYDSDDNKPGKSRTAKAALIDGYDIYTLLSKPI